MVRVVFSRPSKDGKSLERVEAHVFDVPVRFKSTEAAEADWHVKRARAWMPIGRFIRLDIEEVPS